MNYKSGILLYVSVVQHRLVLVTFARHCTDISTISSSFLYDRLSITIEGT